MGKFGVMSSHQVWRSGVAGLRGGGVRNTLRVLREMELDGLVVSERYACKVWAVGGGGFGHWEHALVRNDFLLWKGWLWDCDIEVPVRKGGEVVLVADAAVRLNGDWLFIEVDRRQKKKANLEKVRTYGSLGVKFCVVCYRSRGGHFPGCVKYYIEDMTG